MRGDAYRTSNIEYRMKKVPGGHILQFSATDDADIHGFLSKMPSSLHFWCYMSGTFPIEKKTSIVFNPHPRSRPSRASGWRFQMTAMLMMKKMFSISVFL